MIIVGKQGWMVKNLSKDCAIIPSSTKPFFWLEAISDEYLEKSYAACTCLIAASQGEGFGLPLVEAARYDFRSLRRDIPAFREVAGGHRELFYRQRARRSCQCPQELAGPPCRKPSSKVR